MNPKQDLDKKVIDRLNSIAGLYYGDSSNEKKHLDALTILSLPDNLRKTAMAIHKRKRATAGMISDITGREKAVEYNCLNQLVDMGFLNTQQENDEVYFII